MVANYLNSFTTEITPDNSSVSYYHYWLYTRSRRACNTKHM